jgi:hypothetical protein
MCRAQVTTLPGRHASASLTVLSPVATPSWPAPRRLEMKSPEREPPEIPLNPSRHFEIMREGQP